MKRIKSPGQSISRLSWPQLSFKSKKPRLIDKPRFSRFRTVLIFSNLVAISVMIWGLSRDGSENIENIWLHSHPAALEPEYDNSEFIWEDQHQAPPLYDDEEWHGIYFNLDHGARRTVGQPQHWQHTIWMLGDSTLYGWRNPDWGTIPSYLQLLMPDYHIVNLARWNVQPYQLLAQTKQLPLCSGDMIIWYTFVDTGDQPNIQAVNNIKEWSLGKQIDFMAFSHPFLYSISPTLMPETISRLDPDEMNCTENPATEPGTSISLLHLLDNDRLRGEQFYFDCIHVNTRANAIIAKAIYTYLRFTF